MTANSASPLLKPLRIGRLTVPGRLYKSATSETRATDEGYVTDELLEFYEPMVRAGDSVDCDRQSFRVIAVEVGGPAGGYRFRRQEARPA